MSVSGTLEAGWFFPDVLRRCGRVGEVLPGAASHQQGRPRSPPMAMLVFGKAVIMTNPISWVSNARDSLSLSSITSFWILLNLSNRAVLGRYGKFALECLIGHSTRPIPLLYNLQSVGWNWLGEGTQYEGNTLTEASWDHFLWAFLSSWG